MKKLFFTAIAVVAFSSASMANTIANEEVVKDNKEKSISKEKSGDCCIYTAIEGVENWSETYILSDVETEELYQFLYDLCIQNGSTGFY